jgi:hypothetical protein
LATTTHPPAAAAVPIHRGGVGKADLGGTTHGFLEGGAQRRVDLVGDHSRSGGGQRPGEGSRPGTDLHHLRPGTDPGDLDDAPHQVGLDQEVLAEVAPQPNPVTLEEGPGLAPAQGLSHRETPAWRWRW